MEQCRAGCGKDDIMHVEFWNPCLQGARYALMRAGLEWLSRVVESSGLLATHALVGSQMHHSRGGWMHL